MPSVSRIEFAGDSILRWIESFAFCLCTPFRCSFCLPPYVEIIDGAAFVDSDIREIGVPEWKPHFRASGDFFISMKRPCLVRYFGREPAVTVVREIRVFGHRSLARSPIRTLAFETICRLRRAQASVFNHCFLWELFIPLFVESIDGSGWS
jgi:hypothetical protein